MYILKTTTSPLSYFPYCYNLSDYYFQPFSISIYSTPLLPLLYFSQYFPHLIHLSSDFNVSQTRYQHYLYLHYTISILSSIFPIPVNCLFSNIPQTFQKVIQRSILQDSVIHDNKQWLSAIEFMTDVLGKRKTQS